MAEVWCWLRAPSGPQTQESGAISVVLPPDPTATLEGGPEFYDVGHYPAVGSHRTTREAGAWCFLDRTAQKMEHTRLPWLRSSRDQRVDEPRGRPSFAVDLLNSHVLAAAPLPDPVLVGPRGPHRSLAAFPTGPAKTTATPRGSAVQMQASHTISVVFAAITTGTPATQLSH